MSEEEEVDGASVSNKSRYRYRTTDSDLKPSARLRSYESNAWRVEVRVCVNFFGGTFYYLCVRFYMQVYTSTVYNAQ